MKHFRALSLFLISAWLLVVPAFGQAVTNVPCNQLPAITGDVTRPAGSCASTLAAGSASNLNSGTLPAARMPALTGDCTTSAGAVATTCTKINGVDETTAWASYTPTISCGGGTTTGSVPTGFFKTIGKTTFVRLILTTTTTTCTSVVLGLPNTSQGGVELVGRESAANGAMFICSTAASAATCSVFSTTGSGSGAINSALYTFTGVYDSQ